MFNNIKAVIFDLDGTLADSVPAIRDAINAVRISLGLEKIDYNGTIKGLNRGAKYLVTKTIAEDLPDGERRIDEIYDLYCDAYKKTFTNTKKMYDGMHETLTELKKRGIKLCVLSNKDESFIDVLVHQFEPDGTFFAIAGPTDSVITKPDSRLTNKIISKLGSTKPDEIIMVGDSEIDILTAKNAGVHFVGAAWGFRGRKFLEENGSECVIDQPTDLLEIIN